MNYDQYFKLILSINILFELIVGLLYVFNTKRQIFLVRGEKSDSALTNKYAKSFGITLICLTILSVPFLTLSRVFYRNTLILTWILYHALVIWNNTIYRNNKDIIVHSIFLFQIRGGKQVRIKAWGKSRRYRGQVL